MANTTFTFDDVIYIFKQVLIDFPYIPCIQPDTFTLISDGKEFNTANFRASSKDYHQGYFYSRKWVNGGEDINLLKAHYPIVALEHKVTGIPDLSKRTECPEFWIIAADQIDCPSCPSQCDRSEHTVSKNVSEMLLAIIREAYKYEKFDVMQNGVSSVMWMPEAKAEYLLTSGVITSYEHTGVCIGDYMELIGGKMQEWGRGLLIDNVIGWGMRLKVCGCGEPFTFEYTTPGESTKVGHPGDCVNC